MRACTHAIDTEETTMNQSFVFKQEPFEMYPLQGARLPFVPIKGATERHFEMPEMPRDRPRAPTGPRLRKIGQILILPDDALSPLYGEIPLFYSGDDPDLFLGRLVKRVSNVAKDVGRVAQK